MYGEIGGEFWLDERMPAPGLPKPDWLHFGKDVRFFLSGRTAIDFVLEDVENSKTVYLPSYCCHSMLLPFTAHGLRPFFYDVRCTDNGLVYDIDCDLNCDIFFATSYFGYSGTVMDAAIESFRNKGVCVIEDVTHRLLSKQPYSARATYSIASLRKWLGIPCGGLAVRHTSPFRAQALKTSPLAKLKSLAMRKKADYLFKREGEKQTYLDLFAQFNRCLEHAYQRMEIDELSRSLLAAADIENIKRKRKENGRYLIENLGANKEVKPLLGALCEQDCPLYIPLRVEPDARMLCVRI